MLLNSFKKTFKNNVIFCPFLDNSRGYTHPFITHLGHIFYPNPDGWGHVSPSKLEIAKTYIVRWPVLNVSKFMYFSKNILELHLVIVFLERTLFWRFSNQKVNITTCSLVAFCVSFTCSGKYHPDPLPASQFCSNHFESIRGDFLKNPDLSLPN